MKILLSVLLLISFLGFSDLTWLAPVVGSRLIPRQVIVTKNHLQKTKPVIKEIMPSVATGSSRAVVVEEVPLAHTTQLMPLNPQGELVGRGDISKQVNQVLANISQVLKEADSKIENLVKLNIYLAHPGLEPTVQAQLAQRFKATFKPAVSYVVSDLNAPGALVAMDAIATAVLPANNQGVKYFRSKALGKNSDPVQVALLPAGGVVYVSGQADKGALPEATRGTLQQLKATLAHLDLQLEDVVQLKCFIYPVAGVALVEKEIEQFFKGKTIPPVIYVGWESQNPLVEIELIAAAPSKSTLSTEQITFITPPFMMASPVYSKVTRLHYGKKIYVSGLYGKSSDDPKAEVLEIFSTLENILQQAGGNFNYLAKATYYVSGDQSSTHLNELRPKYYDPKRPPAASKALVKKVGMAGKSITLDMIGVVVK